MANNKDRLDKIESRLRAIGIKSDRPESAFANFLKHVWEKTKANKTTIIPLEGRPFAF